MASCQQQIGRGRGRPIIRNIGSTSDIEDSSSTEKNSPQNILSTNTNTEQINTRPAATSASGRGRGARPRQTIAIQNPPPKTANLTTDPPKPNTQVLKRKELGKCGRHIRLVVNSFPVLEIPKKGMVYQYEVQFNNNNAIFYSRQHRRMMFELWLNRYCSKYPTLNKYKIVFDNQHLMFSLDEPLPSVDNEGYSDEIMGMNRFNRQEKFSISIKPVGNPIALSLLHSLQEHYDPESNLTVDMNAINAIHQSLSVAFHENCSSYADYIYNRSFFTQPTPENRFGEWDLGTGKALWRGFFSCLVFTNGRHKLLMNLDVSHKVFMIEQPFLNFLCQIMRHSPRLGKYLSNKYRGYVLENEKDEVAKLLTSDDYDFLLQHFKNVQVRSNVADKIIGYKIEDLSRSADMQQFLWQRKETPDRYITVEKYYLERYGLPLTYPSLPTLHMFKDCYVPMELVTVKPCRIKKVTDEQRATMCQKSSMHPSQHHQSVCEIRTNPKQQCFESDPFIAAWNMKVDVEMVRVDARVLDKPSITYSEGFTTSHDYNLQVKGSWSSTNTGFYQPAKFPKKWGLINLSSLLDENLCKIFYDELSKVANDRCMECPEPLIYEEYDVNRSPVNTIISAIRQLILENLDFKFFMFILPMHGSIRDQIYGELKTVCEIESATGVVTQMIQLRNNECRGQWNYSRLNNLLMKINAKLNGINSILRVPEVIEKFFSRGHDYMYVGIDLSHAMRIESRVYSTVAVVASADDIPNRYFKEVYVQERSNTVQGQSIECVINMKDIMKSLIQQYVNRRDRPPKAIIIYRDGISTSEFETILEEELTGIRLGCIECSPVYQPYLTYIVVNKRHHTRFFPTDLKDNIQAGTVIDSDDITSPTNYSFYLSSHFSIKGTTRPAYYHVLYDDNKLKPDQIQMLTNALCYTSVRCTRSISIPVPVKYADLLAYRANYYIRSNKQDAFIPINRDGGNSPTITSRRIELSSSLEKDCLFFV